MFMKNLLPVFVIFSLLSVMPAARAADGENLLTTARQFFAPLPTGMPSPDNPITPEKVALGRILYDESRISVDGTVSCSKCHPVGLYAADSLRKAVGNHCKPNPRNTPTILNAAGQISAHWIGNRKDVEDQAKQALIGPPSYGMPSYASVEEKLKALGYAPLFKAAYPNEADPVTADNFAKSVGAFERTLVTPSPFDAFLKGDPAALTGRQKNGLRSFIDRGCVACHNGAFVGGQAYRKFGLFDPYWKYTKSEKIDEGRYALTNDEADKYVFKVPVLRNVQKTPPYFHDGSVDSLGQAVTIMAKIQLGKDLDQTVADDIVAFLGSLTGKVPDDMLRVPLLP
jgi:cytochrome c peroxidase